MPNLVTLIVKVKLDPVKLKLYPLILERDRANIHKTINEFLTTVSIGTERCLILTLIIFLRLAVSNQILLPRFYLIFSQEITEILIIVTPKK